MIGPIRSLPLLPAALALLAACTPYRYDRPGATADERAIDRQQCGDYAWREAVRYSYYAYSPAYGGHYPGASLAWQNHVDTDRFMIEHDLTDLCMQSRGYRLVPDTESPITQPTP